LQVLATVLVLDAGTLSVESPVGSIVLGI